MKRGDTEHVAAMREKRPSRADSKMNLTQHTLSFGESDEAALQRIMTYLGCGYAEAARTAVRVYDALLRQTSGGSYRGE